MEYAVEVLGWENIIHTIEPENHPSIRLAERLGSTRQGPTQLPPPFQDVKVESWGQSAAQWRARRGALVD
jgi:RimJ/RimL family protein N-acetyltransferase